MALVVADNNVATLTPDDAPINYSILTPIPLPKTLLLVNNFIVNTTKFLNKFSAECEVKLSKVSHRITNTNTTLCLLECKLRSVPDIGSDMTTAAPSPQPQAEQGPATAPPEPPTAPTTDGSEQSTALVVAESIPSNMQHASDHPRFRKFFKMLTMRIPMQACQQKMQLELPDEDATILERPDELVLLNEDEMEEI